MAHRLNKHALCWHKLIIIHYNGIKLSGGNSASSNKVMLCTAEIHFKVSLSYKCRSVQNTSFLLQLVKWLEKLGEHLTKHDSQINQHKDLKAAPLFLSTGIIL